MNTTRRELWNSKHTAKSLYLPNGLDSITSRLPEGSGLTVDTIIQKHTMFPYIRPSLSPQRAELVYSMLAGTEKAYQSTYQKAGIVHRRPAIPLHLRFCPTCVDADKKQFGEPYWHRLHQLPGVSVCPIHEEPIRNSTVFVHTIFRYFYPLTEDLCKGGTPTDKLPDDVKTHHINFAKDSMWMLEHGDGLGCADTLYEKHFQLLEVKGYRGHSGTTALCDYQKLNQNIQRFYGRDFLDSVNLYDEVDYSSWPAYIFRRGTTNASTAHHLLMMRFLAGSPQQFFESMERYLPFGDGPWPCRNRVCKFHLKDCIEHIDVTYKQGNPKSTFTCPECGFSYLRGKAKPKELQYDDQVHVLDFGWLWREKLRECLVVRSMSVHQTVLEMDYPDTTIRKYAVEMGLLPESRMPEKRIWKGPWSPSSDTPEESQESRHARWRQLVKDNPSLKKSALGRLDSENYKWLLANDRDWCDKNTPAANRIRTDWEKRDIEFLSFVQAAAITLKGYPDRPRWICYSSLANQAGIGNRIYQIIDKLPLTKAYLDSIVETKTEWRMRKIYWAIETLHSEGRVLSYDSVRHASGVSTRVSRTMRVDIEKTIHSFQEAHQ